MRAFMLWESPVAVSRPVRMLADSQKQGARG
jgi:hypothetical protein